MGIFRYFATDKYAVYIWGSYAVTFVLMAAEIFMLLRRKRAVARRAERHSESPEAHFQTSFQESR